MELIAFYILSAIVVLSALFVISARNPVHSVLWLICAFFTSAGLLVLIGAEFLAMLLVVVYVGAVAVLFLFVVMMLDIDFAELKQGFTDYLVLGGIIAVALLAEIVIVARRGRLDRPISTRALARRRTPKRCRRCSIRITCWLSSSRVLCC